MTTIFGYILGLIIAVVYIGSLVLGLVTAIVGLYKILTGKDDQGGGLPPGPFVP